MELEHYLLILLIIVFIVGYKDYLQSKAREKKHIEGLKRFAQKNGFLFKFIDKGFEQNHQDLKMVGSSNVRKIKNVLTRTDNNLSVSIAEIKRGDNENFSFHTLMVVTDSEIDLPYFRLKGKISLSELATSFARLFTSKIEPEKKTFEETYKIESPKEWAVNKLFTPEVKAGLHKSIKTDLVAEGNGQKIAIRFVNVAKSDEIKKVLDQGLVIHKILKASLEKGD